MSDPNPASSQQTYRLDAAMDEVRELRECVARLAKTYIHISVSRQVNRVQGDFEDEQLRDWTLDAITRVCVDHDLPNSSRDRLKKDLLP